jgi:hypothetical protein
MAYEEPQSKEEVKENIDNSTLSQGSKDAIDKLIDDSGSDDVVVKQISGGDSIEAGTTVAVVDGGGDLDPSVGNAPIVILSGTAGFRGTLGGSTGDMVVAGSAGNDVLVLTPTRPDAPLQSAATSADDTTSDAANVTYETGGGDDDITTGKGDDSIVVNAPGNVTVSSGAGDDMITVDSGASVTVDAGDGYDNAIMSGNRSDLTIAVDESGKVTVSSAKTDAELENVELIKYADDTLTVLADNRVEADVARLYQTLFDREGDEAGLEFWMGRIADGDTLEHIANSFINTDEYQSVLGNSTNEDFIKALYKGMADRDADTAGLDYWVGQLEDGALTRGDVAARFADSNESIELMGVDGSGYVVDISGE